MATLTVYNGSPHPLGFASGKVTINLAIGETRGIAEHDLLREFAKKKSALVDEVMRGTFRLDGFYPSQVLRPRKPPGAQGDIDISIDPDRPRPPKDKVKPLYSTSAPCSKMMALVERARNPPRAIRRETFSIEPVEAKPVEAKPVEAKPVEAKPVEAKPVEAEIMATAEPDMLATTTISVGVLAETEPVEGKPSEEMTVAEIQAWLDTRGVSYSKSARKADLLELALATTTESE